MNPLQIAGSILGTIFTAAVLYYLYDCESMKKAQAQAVIVAEQARERAEKETKRLQGAKEKADVELKNSRGAVLSLAKQLRDARAHRDFLPPAAPGSPSPARASFDRALLERAIQRLDERVSGLIAEGDAATVTLDGLKVWASETR